MILTIEFHHQKINAFWLWYKEDDLVWRGEIYALIKAMQWRITKRHAFEIAMEQNCEVVTLAESNKMKKSYASTG